MQDTLGLYPEKFLLLVEQVYNMIRIAMQKRMRSQMLLSREEITY